VTGAPLSGALCGVTAALPGAKLQAPSDGRVRGVLDMGHAEGMLTDLRRAAGRIQALIALTTSAGAPVAGRFRGTLDVAPIAS